MKYKLIIILLAFVLASCQEKKPEPVGFPFFLNKKCMIVNKEQDNDLEGTYLKVISKKNTDTIKINLPDNFYINTSNFKQWVIGWGCEVPLYDAGVENIRAIDSILPDSTFVLGKLLRGSGYPKNEQNIVFWNINPSGFEKEQPEAVFDIKKINGFHGKSIQFGGMVYDSTISSWVMFYNECDNDTVNTYAAVSDDLLHWAPEKSGKAQFTPGDFKNINWANGNPLQTALVSDIIWFNNKWYIFMDGYDASGKRNIGLAIADKLQGPYDIRKLALISPGTKGSWNDKSCFFAKICRYKDKFIMFYDGRNSNGEENIGTAYSYDLVIWTEYKNNPVIKSHDGWRSSLNTSEPAYIEVRGDSIFLLVAGAKKFKMGFWHHYFTRRMYMDKSGNVDDTELGVFLSTDEGKSFVPHKNNPVFVNKYSDAGENGHLGACFQVIKTDTASYIFYLAKAENGGYNIFLRSKKTP